MSRKLILGGLLAGLFLAILISLFYGIKRGKAPEFQPTANLPPPAGFMKYEDLENKFSFFYPQELSTREGSLETIPPDYEVKVGGTILARDIPRQYCDLAGKCFPKTRNFAVGVYVLKKPFITISQEVKSTIGGMDKKISGRSGFEAMAGAEGEGMYYYFVPLTATKTLLITHRFMDENVLINYKNQTDFVGMERQKKIVSDILNSLAFQLPMPDMETIKVQVYFGNENMVAEDKDFCTEAFAVERIIPKTEGVARATLEALFAGPYPGEQVDGYTSSIPVGTEINSLVIKDGVAKLDLNEVAQSGGGSCSMAARTTQITKTLLQFPSVKSVELSVNGRMGDIFQP